MKKKAKKKVKKVRNKTLLRSIDSFSKLHSEFLSLGGKQKKRNNPADKPDTKEEVFKKAFNDMCKGLDSFGPKEILNLMVIYSYRDDVIQRLLARFPTVVALGDFLRTLPIRKVNKRTFRHLEKSGCIV